MILAVLLAAILCNPVCTGVRAEHGLVVTEPNGWRVLELWVQIHPLFGWQLLAVHPAEQPRFDIPKYIAPIPLGTALEFVVIGRDHLSGWDTSAPSEALSLVYDQHRVTVCGFYLPPPAGWLPGDPCPGCGWCR